MADFRVEGAKIKKLGNLPARVLMNCAFRPAKTPEESYLVLHKRNPLELAYNLFGLHSFSRHR